MISRRVSVGMSATPRRLEIPGAKLEGVYTLRTYQDAQRLRRSNELSDAAY